MSRKKITVELTQEQALALRAAADYILYTGEGPNEMGWSTGHAIALRHAFDILETKLYPDQEQAS